MTVNYAAMDPIHGKVEISFDVDTGVVDVRNGESRALLTRRVDAPLREGTPIGTRAAADLFFTLGGDEVELTVGKGFLSRRSYSVSALVEGVTLTFAPVDDANSAFTRDGVRIALFSKNEESDPRQTDAVWSSTASNDDVVIGYALAEAFDCGALNGAFALIESLVLGGG
ncbi:hypothetical protein ACFT1A_06410 [Rhodococcus sp. NPDC057135]|uniref:hypothetical protein n=1 Tax=Rhodococcus sp. NPDC057135 TaxID=3346028 RepID=UPI0036417DBC